MVNNINTYQKEEDGHLKKVENKRPASQEQSQERMCYEILQLWLAWPCLTGFMTTDFSSSSLFVYISPNCAQRE